MDLAWWAAFLCWIVLATAIRSQQEFAANYSPNHHDDRGKLLRLATIGSAILAAVVSVGLVYLHYSAFGLLWTLALSIGGGVLAAALWGALSALVGDRLLALVSFAGWPLAALGFYLLSGVAER